MTHATSALCPSFPIHLAAAIVCALSFGACGSADPAPMDLGMGPVDQSPPPPPADLGPPTVCLDARGFDDNSRCDAASHCDEDTCVPDVELGEACDEPSDCQSGICTGDVCVARRVEGTSCLDILEWYGRGATNGLYYIDPDGEGPLPPRDVECDMQPDETHVGGGWMVLSRLDFEDEVVEPWAGGIPADRPMNIACTEAYTRHLGGYNASAHGRWATYALGGIPHTEVSVSLDYIVIDSWDGEDAYVMLEGETLWRENFTTSTGRMNVCGGSWRDVGPQRVNVSAPHTRDELDITVDNNLNDGYRDESYGIDNVVVRVR